jgi:hypothetical protein
MCILGRFRQRQGQENPTALADAQINDAGQQGIKSSIVHQQQIPANQSEVTSFNN